MNADKTIQFMAWNKLKGKQSLAVKIWLYFKSLTNEELLTNWDLESITSVTKYNKDILNSLVKIRSSVLNIRYINTLHLSLKTKKQSFHKIALKYNNKRLKMTKADK